jgi:hypothetical protein
MKKVVQRCHIQIIFVHLFHPTDQYSYVSQRQANAIQATQDKPTSTGRLSDDSEASSEQAWANEFQNA